MNAFVEYSTESRCSAWTFHLFAKTCFLHVRGRNE